MDKKIKKKWVAALRSGKYEQGTTLLYDQTTKSFCCLGVLCKVQGVKNQTISGFCYPKTEYRAGLMSTDVDVLAEANDFYGWTFEEIADYIEVML